MGWLQPLVSLNPVSHLISAVRGLADTGTIGIDVVLALAGAAAVVLIFAPLTVRAYMRKA